VQEQKLNAQSRVDAVRAQLRDATSRRAEREEAQKALRQRCAEATSQVVSIRGLIQAGDPQAGAQQGSWEDQRSVAHSGAARGGCGCKHASQLDPPLPASSEAQSSPQCLPPDSIFTCVCGCCKLPDQDAVLAHCPISSDHIAAHAACACPSAAGDGMVCELGASLQAYQASVLQQTQCDADKVAWWVQLHADVAPGKPLSFSSACASMPCAASMCLWYYLSAAESIVLVVAEQCFEDVRASRGTSCLHFTSRTWLLIGAHEAAVGPAVGPHSGSAELGCF
jgi:hypothetical protein